MIEELEETEGFLYKKLKKFEKYRTDICNLIGKEDDSITERFAKRLSENGIETVLDTRKQLVYDQLEDGC